MDAITLLRKDHQKVKELFGEVEKAEDPTRRKELFDRIMTELTVHERIEEEIFYPAVEERARAKEVKEMMIESYLEHGFVDRIAQDVLATKPDDETWMAKVKIMKEQLEHHAFEEEEEKLFPKVEEMFSKEELADLGTEMGDLKDEALEELEEAGAKT
jgi:hemerythrin superfamily protein